MKSIARKPQKLSAIVMATLALTVVIFGIIFVSKAYAAPTSPSADQRLITIHDKGHDRGIITRATTLREAFKEASIRIDPSDMVEPGLDETLVANNYEVNVYRARPVTIIDGSARKKIMSPYRTAKQITKQAHISLHDEDIATLNVNTDMVAQGAGVQLTVDRATKFTLLLYGTETTAYTQEKTVVAMLKSKGITLDKADTLSVSRSAKIKKGMTVAIWRNGKQTVTREQAINFETEIVHDMDRPIGYRQVKTPGVKGKRKVTFEVEMKHGQEIARKEIQSIVAVKPKKQIEVIGGKSRGDGLTKSKGAHFFTDSKGVVHRETYYDLPMNAVMRACGGGDYTVRGDGAKIDKEGYILIAANLSRYPRCSVVETSLGLGRVYDTGGFAAVHPDGFDLATDWSNNNGR